MLSFATRTGVWPRWRLLMGARIRELIDRVIEKVRALATPPPIPVPVIANPRPRR